MNRVGGKMEVPDHERVTMRLFGYGVSFDSRGWWFCGSMLRSQRFLRISPEELIIRYDHGVSASVMTVSDIFILTHTGVSSSMNIREPVQYLVS